MTNSMPKNKKLSREEFRRVVVEHMTLQWLKQNDLDPSDPKTPAIEIDESEETSQLVAWKLTAEEAYDFMLEALEKIDNMGYEIEDEEDEEEEEDLLRDFREDSLDNRTVSFHTPQETKSSKSRLTKSNTTFLFLDTPPGEPFYVSDVRKWLAEVDSLHIPDDTEVEGSLFISYDTAIETSERSECLYCGDNQDILLTVHDCRGGDEDV